MFSRFHDTQTIKVSFSPQTSWLNIYRTHIFIEIHPSEIIYSGNTTSQLVQFQISYIHTAIDMRSIPQNSLSEILLPSCTWPHFTQRFTSNDHPLPDATCMCIFHGLRYKSKAVSNHTLFVLPDLHSPVLSLPVTNVSPAHSPSASAPDPPSGLL